MFVIYGIFLIWNMCMIFNIYSKKNPKKQQATLIQNAIWK